MRQIIAIILAASFLGWAGFVKAADFGEQIATVVAVRGAVVAVNGSQKRKLSIKNQVYKSDTILTGKHGRIQLLFKDTTIISLARNTNISLTDYSWDPAAKKGRMKTTVKEGTFRIMGGAITKFSPQHFTTKTPTATIGIRGSMYAGVVTPNSLSVVFQGGKGIDIMNAAGSVAITRPGFGTHVLGANRPPVPPKKFSAVDMAAINNALNGPLEPEEQIQPGENQDAGADNGGQVSESGDQQTQGDNGENGGDEAGPPPEDGGDGSTDAVAAGNEEGGTDGTVDDGQVPPPPDDQMVADDGTTPPPDGTMLPPDGQIITADGDMLQMDDGSLLPPPPPSGTVDQFGAGVLEPVIDPSVDNIVTSAVVDSSQSTTGTGSTSVSSSLPTDGISQYSGILTGSGGGDPINATTFMVVNWLNGKVLGIVDGSSTDPNMPQGPPSFFIGDINGTGVSNVKMFGSDFNDGSGSVVTHEVTGASGSFFGDSYQFFDFSAIGNDYDIKTQSLVSGAGSWDVAATTARDSGPPAGSVPTGTHIWKGFVVGVAENMNNPDTGRKRFMNNSSNSFSLAVNKTAGTMTGSISADSLEDGDSMDDNIAGLNVGGGLGSVYVRDDIVAAIIGCTGNCIDTNANGTPDVPTDPHGSYMITSGPEDQMSPYFTWGYWETAFNVGGNEYHAHIPGTMWLAGQRTEEINSSYITPSFKGTYNGTARGVEIPSTGGMKELMNGTCHFDVDLSTGPVATGYINFPGVVNMTIGGSGTIAASNAGFTTNITNLSGGTVNAAFFGAQANAIGGNFEAYDSIKMSNYMGIFGANR